MWKKKSTACLSVSISVHSRQRRQHLRMALSAVRQRCTVTAVSGEQQQTDSSSFSLSSASLSHSARAGCFPGDASRSRSVLVLPTLAGPSSLRGTGEEVRTKVRGQQRGTSPLVLGLRGLGYCVSRLRNPPTGQYSFFLQHTDVK